MPWHLSLCALYGHHTKTYLEGWQTGNVQMGISTGITTVTTVALGYTMLVSRNYMLLAFGPVALTVSEYCKQWCCKGRRSFWSAHLQYEGPDISLFDSSLQQHWDHAASADLAKHDPTASVGGAQGGSCLGLPPCTYVGSEEFSALVCVPVCSVLSSHQYTSGRLANRRSVSRWACKRG